MSATSDPSRGPAPDAVRAAHHQIGNSLQSIVSLLTLESRSAPPEAATVLCEAGRRVRIIMRLHQRLQESGADRVRLDDLLSDVVRDVAALDAGHRKVDLRIDLKPVCAHSRTASAIAMITAEWVGNALEHGLADRDGAVVVTLEPFADGARLVVSDNGVGDTCEGWSPGFGLTLIARLIRQINGQLTQTVNSDGTRLELTCPGLESGPDCQ